MKIPIIDYESMSARSAFVSSIKETGFGVLTNTPVSKKSIRATYDQYINFFSFPQEDKDVLKSENGNSGNPRFFYPVSSKTEIKTIY